MSNQSVTLPANTNTTTAKGTTVNPKDYLRKRITVMMGILSAQFVVGMSLNTIGQPDATTQHSINVLWHSLLILHIVIGISLLLSAAYILYYSVHHYRELRRTATIALIGITGAIVFGSLTARGFHRELMSFFMALFFLAAISVYGNSLHT